MRSSSPFTYLVEGLLTVGIANAPVVCAKSEYLHFSAPSGKTCQQYLEPFISKAGGYLLNNSTSECQFCSLDNTNTFLELASISFDHRWRDFGILFVYIIFNIFAATAIYWLARMPKGKKFQGKNKDGDLALVKTKSNATSRGEKHHVAEDIGKENSGVGGRYTPGGSSSYSEKHEGPETPEKTIDRTTEERTEEKRYEPIVAPKAEKADEAEESTPPDRPTTERFVTASEF